MHPPRIRSVSRTILGLLILPCYATFSQTAPASSPSEGGREFWLVFQKNFRDVLLDDRTRALLSSVPIPEPLMLRLTITAGRDARGYVEMPAFGFRRQFEVKGGASVTVDIDTAAQLRSSGIVEKRAVHLVADAPVTVYGSNHRAQTTDSYLAYPVDLLGKSYRAICYRWMQDDLVAQVAVVATEDDTRVRISPTARVASTGPSTMERPGPVPIDVTLDRGEVYQIIAAHDPLKPCDLTGTSIEADKPVGVFSGHNCAYVPNTEIKACNLLVEQMPPIPSWGTEYYVGTLASRSGAVVRVLATEDETHVRINGTLVATLAAGAFYERDQQRGTLAITSDRPVLVAQYATGFGNGDDVGDPMMLVVSPVSQYATSYRFATAMQGSWHNFVNVTAPTARLDGLLLDGRPVERSRFAPVGDGSWSCGTIEVDDGAHVIAGTAPFGMYSYGFGYNRDAYDAYGSAGGHMVGRANR